VPAEDPWASFVAMTDPETGLPADTLGVDGERSVQTSTTNIGAAAWMVCSTNRIKEERRSGTCVAQVVGLRHTVIALDTGLPVRKE
jgi:hypothetical protein